MNREELKEVLISAADRYETTDFIQKDPVQFPHRYTLATDIEIAGLLTALISFGNRRQILARSSTLCAMMQPCPTEYIRRRLYEADFRADDSRSFYRMVSYSAFRSILDRVAEVYVAHSSLAEYLSTLNGSPMERMCRFLGVSDRSPQKKINMFLRWMIRRNSAVDFGIWRQFSPASLIIPLDTHVVHTAFVLGLTDKEQYSLSAARKITAILEEVFPGDPVRGDFALFGLGVENEI